MAPSSKPVRTVPVNPDEAARLSRAFADLAYTQEPGYALEAAAHVGARCEFVALVGAGAPPLGYAALRIKRLPVLGGGLAYLHGGPATRRIGEGFSQERWAQCLGALAEHCAQRGLTLRLSAPGDDGGAAAYRALGFHPARQEAGRTIVLDLAPPLEGLRAGFTGKWRADLRKAEGAGLRIERSASPADIARLQPMLAALAGRKGFALRQDAEFFARAAARSAGAEPPPFVVHLAYLGKRMVGGHIGAFTGESAVYLLGAADEAGREARASYALQWAAIAYARERGLARYDLGGIDRAANPEVYRFKSRMGGTELERPAWWERRAGLVRPLLIAAAERVRGMRAR